MFLFKEAEFEYPSLPIGTRTSQVPQPIVWVGSPFDDIRCQPLKQDYVHSFVNRLPSPTLPSVIERKTTAASALAWQLGGANLPLRQDHPGRGGSRSSVFSVACHQRTPGAAVDASGAHLKSVDEALGRHTHRKMSSRKQQPLPLEGVSLCKVGSFGRLEFLKGCSPVSWREEVQPVFSFRCPQSPPSRDLVAHGWCSPKTSQPRAIA